MFIVKLCLFVAIFLAFVVIMLGLAAIFALRISSVLEVYARGEVYRARRDLFYEMVQGSTTFLRAGQFKEQIEPNECRIVHPDTSYAAAIALQVYGELCSQRAGMERTAQFNYDQAFTDLVIKEYQRRLAAKDCRENNYNHPNAKKENGISAFSEYR